MMNQDAMSSRKACRNMKAKKGTLDFKSPIFFTFVRNSWKSCTSISYEKWWQLIMPPATDFPSMFNNCCICAFTKAIKVMPSCLFVSESISQQVHVKSTFCCLLIFTLASTNRVGQFKEISEGALIITGWMRLTAAYQHMSSCSV